MAIQFVWLFVCSISLILRRFLVVLSTYSATNCFSFYKINHVPCEIVSIRCEASSMAARFILIAFTTQWSFSMVCHSNSCCDSNRDQASITFIWIQLLSEIVRKKSIDQWESNRERVREQKMPHRFCDCVKLSHSVSAKSSMNLDGNQRHWKRVMFSFAHLLLGTLAMRDRCYTNMTQSIAWKAKFFFASSCSHCTRARVYSFFCTAPHYT